jgi:hypothetical protein
VATPHAFTVTPRRRRRFTNTFKHTAHGVRFQCPRTRPRRQVSHAPLAPSAFLTAHKTDAARLPRLPRLPRHQLAASVSPHVFGLCTDSGYHSAPAAEMAACVSLKRRARASCVSEKRRSTSSIKARVERKVEKAPWHVVAMMR